jgi:hypothetical protein
MVRRKRQKEEVERDCRRERGRERRGEGAKVAARRLSDYRLV